MMEVVVWSRYRRPGEPAAWTQWKPTAWPRALLLIAAWKSAEPSMEFKIYESPASRRQRYLSERRVNLFSRRARA